MPTETNDDWVKFWTIIQKLYEATLARRLTWEPPSNYKHPRAYTLPFEGGIVSTDYRELDGFDVYRVVVQNDRGVILFRLAADNDPKDPRFHENFEFCKDFHVAARRSANNVEAVISGLSSLLNEDE